MSESPEQPDILSDGEIPASDVPPAAAAEAPDGGPHHLGVFEHREAETAEVAETREEPPEAPWSSPAESTPGVYAQPAVSAAEGPGTVLPATAAVYGQQDSPAKATSDVPSIAGTLEVPPLKTSEHTAWGDTEADGEGGEFQLLINRLKGWWESTDFDDQLRRLSGPLRAVALLLGVILLLRLYSGLLDTLEDLPLVPRLLQLIGVIGFLRFGFTRLIKSSDREQILAVWKQRWQDIAGTGR